MINHVFSKDFINLIGSEKNININNINRDLIELFIAGIFTIENKSLIWIVGENENFWEKSAKLKSWLSFFSKDSSINFYIPPFEDPYINNLIDINSIVHKVNLILNILNKKKIIVITTLSALSIKLEDGSLLKDFFLKVNEGEVINRDNFLKKLIDMGYVSKNIVEMKGDVAWRGSIVDIFPINEKNPVRIEIEGDKIFSIRKFDTETQKSIEQIKEVLFSASKYFLNSKDSKDYFNKKTKNMRYLTELLIGYRLICSDRGKIEDEFTKLMKNYEKIYNIALNKKNKVKRVEEIFDFPFKREKVLGLNETHDSISKQIELVKIKNSICDFNKQDIEEIKNKIKDNKTKLFIFSEDKRIGENLKEHFEKFSFFKSSIPFSFENKRTGTLFLTYRNFRYIEEIEKYRELKSENLSNNIRREDLIVHKKHGVGRFVGFKKLEFESNSTEFLKIEYMNKEFLYVPVYEIDVLDKYVSFEGYTPKLDKMGGVSWSSKQKKARKSIINFAKDLLELYALRKSLKGNIYAKDSEMEDKLQEEFLYVETEDQKRAIRDTFYDLEAEYPMDRLICGDVSFGKTEVALRAAFRVVTGGKQAVLLCPTTILAYQHYMTFKRRLAKFPINVVMLSRMVSKREITSILKNLEKGKIDIVIGTHLLISREINFRDLGLYIIDEEQRFGVFQKEKLKKHREDIDVLSLSATPIPRTLSLSLAGLQDISIIQTPPIGRVAIKNYVGIFSREILISAILKEIDRDGLVFIIYNNINKIYTFERDLLEWLPDISTVVLHAKMKSESIEKNLLDFINKKYRVLITTTIIENGIDIPDVNTLIVVDADRFGLTQLYQLRGRIGRGNRQAYSYFMVNSMNISDKAKSRLEAIRDFADLGSGYKLAEFDLKLRGAGSLLGNKQHGHIEALGFDYYHKLLLKTVKELKGEMEREIKTSFKVNFSYSIDKSYIKNSAERVSFYRRILEAREFEEVDELKKELIDRYGRLHESIKKIFFAGLIRLLVNKCQFEEVELFLDKIVIEFTGSYKNELIFEKKFFEMFDGEIIDGKRFVFHFKDPQEFIDEFRRQVN